jgi:GT2 family glycosyltransferase
LGKALEESYPNTNAMSTKISIITTTFNRKVYLQEQLQSIQQTVLDPLKDIVIEQIVYDDGSTDNTEDLFKNNRSTHIKYIKSAKNHGPAFGRNQALKEAQGEYIFFLDSDDLILQRTFYNFLTLTIANHETDIFIADFLRIDQDKRYMCGEDYFGWPFKNNYEVLQAIFKGQHYIQHSFLCKKSVIEAVGGYDETLHQAEDLDLYVRILLAGYSFQYCNFISRLARIHTNNLSRSITTEIHAKDLKLIYNKYQSDLEKLKI